MRCFVRFLALCLLLPALAAGCSAERPLAWLVQPCLFELPGPAPTPTAADPTCTVGTYNLDGLRSPVLLQQDLAQLPFVQLWTFQEVHIPLPPGSGAPACQDLSQRAVRQLSAILPPGPWYGAFIPVNQAGGGLCEGQATVSRWPLRDPIVWKLAHSGKKDRVALACTIELGGAPLLVVNTDHEVGWYTLTATDRALQVATLLDRTSGLTQPLLLAGDFNTTGDFRNLWNDRQETRQLLVALRTFTPATPPDWITFHDGIARFRLDHIFTRGLIPLQSGTLSSRGSDHDPIWSRLQLPQPPPPASDRDLSPSPALLGRMESSPQNEAAALPLPSGAARAPAHPQAHTLLSLLKTHLSYLLIAGM